MSQTTCQQRTPISIAICSYNRSDQLAITLEQLVSVSSELIDGDELLIIDNNSSDNTPDVVSQYQDKLPIRYLFEGRQGLSASRNCALRSFVNSALVFIDDDINVLPNTLLVYRTALLENPAVGFFGGRLLVYWEGGAPNWLNAYELPMLNGMLGHYRLERNRLSYPPQTLLPYGANFALRRSLIDKVGEFDAALGVNGKSIGRGEESDYFQRSIDLGFTGLYLDDAKMEHRFQRERLTLPYLYRYGIQKGLQADNAIGLQWVFGAAAQLVRGLYQLLKGRRDYFYQCVINVGLYRGLSKAGDDQETEQ